MIETQGLSGTHGWSTRTGLLGTFNLVSAAINRLKFSLASDVACREYELDGILNRLLADSHRAIEGKVANR